MSKRWLVMRESDVERPNGLVLIWSFSQEGPARAKAEEFAASHIGVRYVVLRSVAVCERSVSPPEWDEVA